MPPKANPKQARRARSRRRQAKPQDITLKLENRLLGKIDARLSKVRFGPFQVQSGPSASGVMTPSFKTGAVPGYKDALRISGQERLGDLITTGPVQPGQVLYTIGINPSNIGSRLTAYGHLYNKFCFRRFDIVWVPRISIANSNASGELLFAVDPDPTDRSVVAQGSQVEDINDMFSWEGSQATSLFNPITFEVRRLDPKNVYYMHTNDGDARLTTQGIVYVVAATELPNDDNYGTLYLRYEVDMYVPQATATLTTQQNFWFGRDVSESFDWGRPIGNNIVAQYNNALKLFYDDTETLALEVPGGGVYLVLLRVQRSSGASPPTIDNSNAKFILADANGGIDAISENLNTPIMTVSTSIGLSLWGWCGQYVVRTKPGGQARIHIFMSSPMGLPTVNLSEIYCFQVSDNDVHMHEVVMRRRRLPTVREVREGGPGGSFRSRLAEHDRHQQLQPQTEAAPQPIVASGSSSSYHVVTGDLPAAKESRSEVTHPVSPQGRRSF